VGLFDRLAADGYEQVVHCHDAGTGLRAIVAIHSTRLGPALGGTRCFPYADEEAALTDVLRLARGMTYKAAAAGLDVGGGKAVIIGDPRCVKTEPLLRAYGRFVDSLGGRYLTAEDVGTTQADMDVIRAETTRVTGTSLALGGSGDPSEATADGLLSAISAMWPDGLSGLRVVVSGAGKVGSGLARRLFAAGAEVTVADIDADRVAALKDELGIPSVSPEEAHRTPCDVFSPCALGAVLSETTIPELACRAVIGAANNQLATPADARRLSDRGVIYAPDFVVNAGGVINLCGELAPGGYNQARTRERVATIGRTLREVLDDAEARGITTAEAAEQRAERRIAALDGIRHLRTFPPRRTR
jgi:glutamate dehydrogenase/leucine dehydrogenase